MTQLSPTLTKDALQSTAPIDSIQVQGWVRTRRDSKDFSFIEMNDGSTLRTLQIIAKNSLPTRTFRLTAPKRRPSRGTGCR